MNLKPLLLCILLFPTLTFGKEVIFNRLDKLYTKDKAKCLLVANRYMDLFPDQAAPYYFATVYYRDKSQKSKNARGEAIHLNRALGYAITFEGKKTIELEEKVNWTSVKSELKNSSIQLIHRLNETGEYSIVTNLIERFEKLDIQFTNDNLAFGEASPEATGRNADLSASNLFFGMPSGDESVMSFNAAGEMELLDLINAERVKMGMNSLEWDEDLSRACRYHSCDLATQNYFNHSSYDRENGNLVQVGNAFDRIKLFYERSFINAENIGAGFSSPKEIYLQWYESKGHFDNMFNPESKKVGIGVFYAENSDFNYYWTFCTAM